MSKSYDKLTSEDKKLIIKTYYDKKHYLLKKWHIFVMYQKDLFLES